MKITYGDTLKSCAEHAIASGAELNGAELNSTGPTRPVITPNCDDCRWRLSSCSDRWKKGPCAEFRGSPAALEREISRVRQEAADLRQRLADAEAQAQQKGGE